MTQLVEELRRRGVLKTAAMYAAGAWLLTEVSATMLPALHFPEWSLTAVVLLVLLGFPENHAAERAVSPCVYTAIQTKINDSFAFDKSLKTIR